MPFPLPEDFKPGTPLRDIVTAETMRTVNAILNSLTVEVREGLDYPYIEKTARPGEQQPWVIVLPAPVATGPELSDSDPSPDASEASPGEATDASRSDHAHPINVDDENAPNPDVANGDVGESSAYARADHAHELNVDDETPPQGVASSGSVGTSDHYARADHKHAGVTNAGTTDAPSDQAPGADVAGGAAGTAASRVYANWDHKHPLNVGSTIPGADTSSGSAGSGEVYARDDHKHTLNAPTAGGGDGTDYPGDIIVDPDEEVSSGHIGSSNKYARADHDHRCDGCGTEGPSSPASKTDVSTGTNEPTSNNSTTWGYDGTKGLQVTLVTGLYYDHTAATPQLIARVRTFLFDVDGRLYSMGAEGSYVVDQPIKVTIATS